MKHEIMPDGNLKITVTKEEMCELKVTRSDYEQGLTGDWCWSSVHEAEILEPLLANSELQWIAPSETGDLTDAPMIGIRNEDDTVHSRWAFMDYQVRSFIDDLIDKGEAIFTGGPTIKMDAFTKAYIDCALWSSVDTSDNMKHAAIEAGYSVVPRILGFGFMNPEGAVSTISFEYEFEAWMAICEEELGGSEPDEALDKRYSIADIAPEAMDKIIEDCRIFQEDNLEDLDLGRERSEMTDVNAGIDFWLTRNHHGDGFWDGDWDKDLGRRLTDAAHRFKEMHLYVGDDGQIYCD